MSHHDAPARSRRGTRAAHTAACAAVLALVLVALYPVGRHDFIDWDDPHNLFENPTYNPPTLRGLARHWAEPLAGLYVPVLYTTWYPLAVVARHTGQPGQLDPRVFHVASIVAHALCALVVYALLHALLVSAARGKRAAAGPTSFLVPAAIGATIFAVHPVQVEAVAWISGFKDVLCGLLSVVALLLYVRHADTGAPRSPPRRAALYAVAMLAFALALLAKPVAVVLPVVAGVVDRGLLRRAWPSVVGSVVPWVVLAIPVALLTRAVQEADEARALAPLHLRPLVAADALAFHVRNVLFPARLALDYGRSPDVVARAAQTSWLVWLAWLAPLAIALVLWVVRRRARPLVVGAIVFLVALAPVLGLVPFSFQIYSTVADHYLYLPMVGVALAAAWAASLLRPRAALAIAAPLVIVLGVRSWQQTWHWRDTRAIFTHTLDVNPQSWTAHINVAAAALLENDAVTAERHSRAALALRRADGRIYTNLGVALGMQSRPREAADALARAVELAPRDAASHYWYGEALAQLGRLDDAEREFLVALRLDPRRADARAALARLRAARPSTTPASTPARS